MNNDVCSHAVGYMNKNDKKILKLNMTLDYQQDVGSELRKKVGEYLDFRILSKSLDARGANRGKRPRENYVLEVRFHKDQQFSSFQQQFPQLQRFEKPPLIIGAGPAGLFCALRFSEYGIDCRILERGPQASQRMKHIARFWRYGEFNPEANVCYGEGGAGLFSDGKLITRIKSPYVQYVMQRFVDFGAPEETAYLSNPHLGSNKIRALISKMTDHLKEKNHQIDYNTRVDDFIVKDGAVCGVITQSGEKIYSDHIILATGHSARSIYHVLLKNNIDMVAKDFAVGARIEHPRGLIDFLQYGKFGQDESLGAARYRLSYFDPIYQRGNYSFCMCPGGYVLSAGTEADGFVVNGMSNYARNSPWSNAAMVVTVKSGQDFEKELLSGLYFQEEIEKKAYQASLLQAQIDGEKYPRKLPAQRVSDFLKNIPSSDLPTTSCPSKIFPYNLSEILPEFVCQSLKKALLDFDQKMPGFVDKEAVLIAPETRTSAPVTIRRDKETLISLSHSGLYPCGEGAGYAGGITSAAVDGIKVCESILKTKK